MDGEPDRRAGSLVAEKLIGTGGQCLALILPASMPYFLIL